MTSHISCQSFSPPPHPFPLLAIRTRELNVFTGFQVLHLRLLQRLCFLDSGDRILQKCLVWRHLDHLFRHQALQPEVMLHHLRQLLLRYVPCKCLVLISSLLDTSSVEEIYTNCTSNRYVHWKIHGELKITVSAIYFCLYMLAIILGKHPFESGSLSFVNLNTGRFWTISLPYNNLFWTSRIESTV